MSENNPRAGTYVTAVTVLAGLFLTIAGGWHFLPDLGAFQIGLGIAVLLALVWSDALMTALTGFLVANTVHTVNHVIDLDHGGNATQAVLLGLLSLLVAAAVVLRYRQLGLVVGTVGTAVTGELAPYVRQKTVSVTTFRKDGTPGSTPVSIAVDGDHAYLRSFEKSLKSRRLQRDPRVEVAASTGFGKPTGQVQRGSVRKLHGQEYRHAASMLRRKYPFLHGVLVPLAHRLMRGKTGRTVHFELTLDRTSDRTPEAGRVGGG